MISAGLYLTDLNLFDGTSELLIINMHQTREIENTLEKVLNSLKVEFNLIGFFV